VQDAVITYIFKPKKGAGVWEEVEVIEIAIFEEYEVVYSWPISS